MWEQALVPLRTFYDQHQLLFMRSNLTEIWFLMGRLDDAEQASREIHSGRAGRRRSPWSRSLAARPSGPDRARARRPAAAERHLDQAEELARQA